jgi:hypothetical protein
VTPYIRGDNGAFTVSVNNNAIPSLDDSFTQVVRLSDKQGVGTVVFEGVAGETVLLSARVLTPTTSEPRVEVSQGGDILAANSIGQVSRLLMEFTVPDDGTVEVTVSDFDAESLIVEFSVERMGAAEESAMDDDDSEAVEEVDEPEEVEEATEVPSDG